VHPPLFYYLSACIGRLFSGDRDVTVVAVRLASSFTGLATAGLAALLVHRSDPERPSRALLAVALLIFLPVQIMLSAMFTEEILVSFFISMVVVGLALGAVDREAARAGPGHPDGPDGALLAVLGGVAGLACSTKLSGALVVLVAIATLAIRGLHRGDLRRAARRLAIFGVPALLLGGAYYARNWFEYGFVYPYGLGPHAVMHEMPPGSRELLDYFRFPLAVWTDPQLLSPDLLRSVWGSTYTTWWFDGIRKFLPVDDALVGTLGTVMLVLAVVPTAAGIAGLGSGVRRAFRRPDGVDTPLLLLVAVTIGGYALFNWRNQFFATLKASYLLGLSVPFAYYTSEGLDRWMRRSPVLRLGILVVLAALFVLSALVFSYGLLFTKPRFAGVDWRQILP
jgi:hypothetical protein